MTLERCHRCLCPCGEHLLTYARSVDEYLCDDCLEQLTLETSTNEEEQNDEQPKQH